MYQSRTTYSPKIMSSCGGCRHLLLYHLHIILNDAAIGHSHPHLSNLYAGAASRYRCSSKHNRLPATKNKLENHWLGWDGLMNLKSSNTSSLKRPARIVYIIYWTSIWTDTMMRATLFWRRNERHCKKQYKHEEEAFGTSLASLCLSVENRKKSEGDLTTRC